MSVEVLGLELGVAEFHYDSWKGLLLCLFFIPQTLRSENCRITAKCDREQQVEGV